jgi:hypothetical protein
MNIISYHIIIIIINAAAAETLGAEPSVYEVVIVRTCKLRMSF